MARVKGGYTTRHRRKKILKLAKGYYGAKHLLYKTAHEQVMHSFKYAFNDRRDLKNNMRKLWIARINAAARMNDISYSRLMHGLKLANVTINRKMLSEIAIHDAAGFTAIVETAKKALANPTSVAAAVETPVVEEKAKKAPAKKAAAKEEAADKPAKKAPAKKAATKKADDAEAKPAKKAPAKKAAAKEEA